MALLRVCLLHGLGREAEGLGVGGEVGRDDGRVAVIGLRPGQLVADGLRLGIAVHRVELAARRRCRRRRSARR